MVVRKFLPFNRFPLPAFPGSRVSWFIVSVVFPVGMFRVRWTRSWAVPRSFPCSWLKRCSRFSRCLGSDVGAVSRLNRSAGVGRLNGLSVSETCSVVGGVRGCGGEAGGWGLGGENREPRRSGTMPLGPEEPRGKRRRWRTGASPAPSRECGDLGGPSGVPQQFAPAMTFLSLFPSRVHLARHR